MSRRSLTAVMMGLMAVAGYTCSVAQEPPNLGRPATPAEVAGWDISIPPDGRGLPQGAGTPAEGAFVYAQKCQACHGDKGGGGPNEQLVGGQGTLAGKTPVRTVGSY